MNQTNKKKRKQKTRKESKCWISDNVDGISPFPGCGATWGTGRKALRSRKLAHRCPQNPRPLRVEMFHKMVD